MRGLDAGRLALAVVLAFSCDTSFVESVYKASCNPYGPDILVFWAKRALVFEPRPVDCEAIVRDS